MANEWMNGNTFNLKWTLNEIEKNVKLIRDYIFEDTKGKKCMFIGEAIAEVSIKNKLNLYRKLWYHWQDVLKTSIGCKSEDESDETKDHRAIVLNTIENIDNVIESRLVSGGIKGQTNSTITVFVLKNSKRGWNDQQNVDLTSGGEKVKQFDGTVQIKVLNTNKHIDFDDNGDVIKDDTKQIAESE